MSLNLKLIGSSLAFAFIAILFGAFAHFSQMRSQDLANRVFEEGMAPLASLEMARADAKVLRAHYTANFAPGNSTLGQTLAAGEAAHLLEGLGAVLGHMRAALTMPLAPEAAERLQALLYPLTRLEASQGELSQRMLLRELAKATQSLDDIVAGVREDLSTRRAETERDLQTAAWRNWIGLGIALLAGSLGAFFLTRNVVTSLRAAARAVRAMANGEIDGTITASGPAELTDLFAALTEMQSHWQRTAKLMAVQADKLDDRLAMQQNRFEAALNNMTQALCMLDGGFNLVVYNHAFANLFENLKPGASARELLSDPRFRQVLEPNETGMFIHEMPNGELMDVKRRGMRGNGLLITFENVTEQHRASQRLEHLASHDGLTDLANRRCFRQRLVELLEPSQNARDFAVFTFDLNGFKGINDTFGHPVGDALLQAVGKTLLDCAGRNDMIARLGGDEFAVVQVGGRQPEAATKLARAIVDVFAEPFEAAGRRVSTGVSIGIVPLTTRMISQGLDADHIMQNCDLALYHAKANGRSSYCVFTPDMREEVNERRDLELDLRSALEKDEFELFYQPFVDTQRGAVSGFEALLRWRHPVRGLVAPGVFIPLAEELGLIEGIGIWALHTACAQAADWPEDLVLSVNLSPVQFKSRTLLADVDSALRRSGLAPGRLQLEVTESLFIDEADDVRSTLSALRERGMIISMDDFGTGYSSLGYLSRFPFDKIKIDQSFVRDMSIPENLAVVRAVIGLSRALGVPVIAEGIETEEQLRTLLAEGCHEMQGFFFSKPRPASDLAQILAEVRQYWLGDGVAVLTEASVESRAA